jgi:recombinational DNA repair protein RecR
MEDRINHLKKRKESLDNAIRKCEYCQVCGAKLHKGLCKECESDIWMTVTEASDLMGVQI